MSTTGLFPDAHSDHALLYLFYAMFMSYSLSQQLVMAWRGFVCVCCTVYRLEPEAGSSTEASVCSVIVSSGESLMELFVVFLLISFKEILFACLCP